MVKTVVLIGKPKAPLIYLVNAINEHNKIDLLIIEEPKKRERVKSLSTLDRLKRFIRNNFSKHKTTSYSFFEKVLRYLLFKLGQRTKQKRLQLRMIENEVFYNTLFKGKHLSIDPNINSLTVDDINSKQAEDVIKKIGPNLIIDHGTTLLKDHIINLAEMSLNLHWGLSPYYRGVDCTKRALFNWDIHNIGVTIHKLSKAIDGGDILGQRRINIKSRDNEYTITAKMTYYGTEIIKKAIDLMKLGHTPPFKKQTFVEGYLFKIEHMNKDIENYIDQFDETKINSMIQNPSRGKLPIVNMEGMESNQIEI